jgi:hypothetical protein
MVFNLDDSSLQTTLRKEHNEFALALYFRQLVRDQNIFLIK